MTPIFVAGMSAYPAGGSVPQAAGEAAASRAATKATAYGSSEVGAMLGGAVGPPIVGGIVGGIVGERLGEKGSTRFGITETAGQVSNDLAKVKAFAMEILGTLKRTSFSRLWVKRMLTRWERLP